MIHLIANAESSSWLRDCDKAIKCTIGRSAITNSHAIAHEPILPDMPLSTLDNVLITPHVGGNSIEAALRASYHSAMGSYIKSCKEYLNRVMCRTLYTRYKDTGKPYKLERIMGKLTVEEVEKLFPQLAQSDKA